MQVTAYTVERVIKFGQPKFRTALGAKRFAMFRCGWSTCDPLFQLLPPRLLRGSPCRPMNLGEKSFFGWKFIFIQLIMADSSVVLWTAFWRNINRPREGITMKRYLNGHAQQVTRR